MLPTPWVQEWIAEQPPGVDTPEGFNIAKNWKDLKEFLKYMASSGQVELCMAKCAGGGQVGEGGGKKKKASRASGGGGAAPSKAAPPRRKHRQRRPPWVRISSLSHESDADRVRVVRALFAEGLLDLRRR